MKSFVVVFTVLAAIAASNLVVATPGYVAPAPPQPKPSPPCPAPIAPLKLGTLLKQCIATLVQQIVQLLGSQILSIVPGTTPVPLLNLLEALKPLPSATVATLLALLGKLLGCNLAPVLPILPRIVANTRVNIANLVQVLAYAIPAGIITLPFKTLFSLLAAYLNAILTITLVGLLDSLS